MFFFWVCESITHQFLLLSLGISYPEAINRPTERNVLWLQTNQKYLWACFFFRNLKWHAFKNIWFSTYPCILVSFKSNFAFDIKGLSIWPIMLFRKKINNRITKKTSNNCARAEGKNHVFSHDKQKLIWNISPNETTLYCRNIISWLAYNKPMSMLPYRALILSRSRLGLGLGTLFSWLLKTGSSVSLGCFENPVFHDFCGNYIWR